MAEQETRTEINRLYWETDESVGAIADKVGVSRRALYDSVDPRPADATCPSCGGELAFRNRTSAERGEAECRECGAAHEVTTPETRGPVSEPRAQKKREAARLAPAWPVPSAGSGPIVGAALLAGMAAGAMAGYLIRRG